MTREESIDLLDNLIGMIEDNHNSDYDKALKMAIKSLEQEPCEDAISRQVVLDMMQIRMGEKELYKAVYELPPVTPQPKIGHWKRISIDKYVQHAMAYYKCSVCNKDIIGTHNYCPNCGAKMEREE